LVQLSEGALERIHVADPVRPDGAVERGDFAILRRAAERPAEGRHRRGHGRLVVIRGGRAQPAGERAAEALVRRKAEDRIREAS
jgi:hypothetical protein